VRPSLLRGRGRRHLGWLLLLLDPLRFACGILFAFKVDFLEEGADEDWEPNGLRGTAEEPEGQACDQAFGLPLRLSVQW
jgi:hypothetical protein